MKSILRTLTVAAPIALLLIASCKKDTSVPTGPSPTTVVINGVVTDLTNSQPISAASVQLTTPTQSKLSTTATDGSYSFTLNLGDSVQSATISVTKSGFRTGSKVLPSISSGQSFTADVQLQRDTTTTVTPISPTGGYANTIAYVGPSNVSLAVYGVGGAESAILTFEARDSLGFPITINRSDTITYSISGTPVTGGAYITPTTAMTNSSGRAATVIQSGTVAGTIQLTATLRRDLDGVIVRSTPVRIIVYGGLPDQTHFALGANPFNVPGYYKIGATSTITALVGDKYGNPVAPGTAVYFGNPQQGVITTNTGYTGLNGFATATLYTGANHRPNGLGLIYAQTIGENGATVKDSTLILFSGVASIDSVRTLSGNPLAVSDIAQETVVFRVYDDHYNPLAAGTTVTSEIKGASAIAADASPAVILDDVISPYWTYYRIVVSKNQEASPVVTGQFVMTITVSGPNGSATATISGAVN